MQESGGVKNVKRIALIGLGTVGMCYGEGLYMHGAQVSGYDIKVGNANFRERAMRCEHAGIQIMYSMETLLQEADIVLAVTTPAHAYDTAKEAKPFLKSGQIYVELNSAVPGIKHQIEQMLKGIDVVDGTTMSSVNQVGYQARVNFSGHRAGEVVECMRKYGMNAHYAGDEVGMACALKSVRSIFMKGYEALLMECLAAAQAYGILEDMIESISAYFDGRSFRDHCDIFVTTDAIFAKRRSEEMTAVVEMLKAEGLHFTMAQAAEETLKWLASLQLDYCCSGKVPTDRDAVLKELVNRSGRKSGERIEERL